MYHRCLPQCCWFSVVFNHTIVLIPVVTCPDVTCSCCCGACGAPVILVARTAVLTVSGRAFPLPSSYGHTFPPREWLHQCRQVGCYPANEEREPLAQDPASLASFSSETRLRPNCTDIDHYVVYSVGLLTSTFRNPSLVFVNVCRPASVSTVVAAPLGMVVHRVSSVMPCVL